MMPYFSLSGEENVDNALRLAIEGGEGAYKLLKYFREHHGSDAKKEKLLKDALSMYRGGHYDASKSEELKELLSQLNGGEMTERPFVFLGNNSDLSYFWYKDPTGKPTQLSLATVAAIPDEEIKKRTVTTLARCYIDGLLEYNAVTQTYTLSEKGAAYIYKGEFIQSRSEHHISNAKKEKLLKDALSMYRGGHYDISESKELTELLSQLNGGEMTERPFVFLGNNSDLSYFWYKDPTGKPTQLSLATVAAIPDEEIKKRTATTLARCYIDGLLEYDAVTQTYTLSEKGAAYIYKGEFVQNRLLKEVAFFTKAEIALNEQADEIAKRMEERGFRDHNRVTVDRHSLAAEEDMDGLFCRIPNTKGRDYIRFKPDTFFELTEKTVEVYIAPNEQYTVLDSAGNAKRTVTGAELSKFYEIKKHAQVSEPKVQTASIDGAAYEAGDYVFALNVYEDGYELHQYRVEYAIADKPTGEVIYKLAPTTPGQAEIIQSEHCAGKTMFSGRQEGKAFLATDKGKAAADAIKAEFSKLSAAEIIKASPKFDLYTAAASAAYQSAEKIVRGLQK